MPVRGCAGAGHGDAALEQKSSDLVDHRCAPAHQPVAYPVQRLAVELGLTLERHKMHARPLHRLGVDIVVLVALNEGPHIRAGISRTW